jgi:hypothetical protein
MSHPKDSLAIFVGQPGNRTHNVTRLHVNGVNQLSYAGWLMTYPEIATSIKLRQVQ